MRVIRLGDRTSHGGEVITAASNYEIMGKKVAREHDTVTCPIPGHRAGGIIGGDRLWTIDGRAVALQGPSKTPCGAEIISSCSELDRTFEGEGEAGTDDVSQAAYENHSTDPIPATASQEAYDEQVRIKDETGKLMANVPYHITDESGNEYKGFTDSQGCCNRVFTVSEQSLNILIGVPALEKW